MIPWLKPVRTERLILAALLVLLAPGAARAEKPSFILPAACTLNENCWIVNYADADAEKGSAKDFRCGNLTYDDHNGTDIGVADRVTMEMGVDVVAAAPGKVLRVRDGMDDALLSPEERAQLLAQDKGCGNGVFVEHGGGWQTIYCHMKKDSLAVKPGETVTAGQKLGEIGMSGNVEFPHVHFGVFHEGRTVEPFTGLDHADGCGKQGAPLWAAANAPAYTPAMIYAAGFKDSAPDYEAIKIDAAAPASLPAASPALVFWVAFYGMVQGDRIIIEIEDPAGQEFARKEILQEKNRAQQLYFIGNKTKDGLAPGTYTGYVRVEHKETQGAPSIRETTRTLTVR